MSGAVSGVQKQVSTKYPKAKYFTHDANHRLNLVIVATCKAVPEIRNFMDTFQKMTFFLSNSAKRKAIVKRHYKDSSSLDDMLHDFSQEDQKQLQEGALRIA